MVCQCRAATACVSGTRPAPQNFHPRAGRGYGCGRRGNGRADSGDDSQRVCRLHGSDNSTSAQHGARQWQVPAATDDSCLMVICCFLPGFSPCPLQETASELWCSSGKIIQTVWRCVVCEHCAQWYTYACQQFLQLTVSAVLGFFCVFREGVFVCSVRFFVWF